MGLMSFYLNNYRKCVLSNNPYASLLSGTEKNVSTPTSAWTYRPLGTITKMATIGVAILCVLMLLMTAIEVAGSLMVPTFNDNSAPISSDLEQALLLALSGVALLILPVFIFNIVMTCIFMYRANANVRALGAVGVENSPMWCGGYWFIPILLLFKPYQCMSEINRASQDPLNPSWKTNEPHAMMGSWWACWLVANFLSNLSSRPAISEVLGSSIWIVSLIAAILFVAAGIMLIKILGSISALQTSYAEKI